jgi:serine/threonine protein kinase
MIGPQIGEGAFGKIFAARDSETGLLYAIKNESGSAERKTLAFETKILTRIQECLYFPRLFDSGETNSLAWAAIELVGPSLSAILKHIPAHKLSLSSAIRTAWHTLRALETLHGLGFIHRDLKPADLLVRLSPEASRPPICLIDFGLARFFRDQRTQEHTPPRPRTGFRGTKTYASLNAHALHDLSRRDDLASWFYVLLDLMLGSLPWKGMTSNVDVATMKNRYDVREAVEDLAPRLYDIWLYIAALRFGDEPDYRFIMSVLDEICATNRIDDGEAYDWADFVERYRRTLAAEFGVALRIDGGADLLPFCTELGVPPIILHQIEGRNRTIKSPLVRYGARNDSVIQASEINEGDDTVCCC